VPTQAEVNGDFQRVNRPQRQVPRFWKANSYLRFLLLGRPTHHSFPLAVSQVRAPGKQFPGNKIPQSCISKVSQSLLSLVPNADQPARTQQTIRQNFVPVTTWSNWIITGDHNLTSKQALHGVYWRNHGTTFRWLHPKSAE